MKRIWSTVLAVLAGAAWAWAVQEPGTGSQGAEGDGEYAEIPEEALRAEVGDRGAAEALMARVREGVPRVPLEMHAEVQVLNKYGKKTGTWEAEASLKPDRERGGRKLRYETGEGAMEVWLPEEAGGAAEYSWVGKGEGERNSDFSDGSANAPPFEKDGKPGALAEGSDQSEFENGGPRLDEAVGGADFTWEELGFGFFWWKNPRITGVEKLRHRWNCQVVELDGPKGETLRLWVAPSWGAVVQGELARGGTVEKRFEVESVTKVRKVYMLSEMTVRNAATGGRSRLKLGNLRMVAPDYTEEEWKAFEEPVRW